MSKPISPSYKTKNWPEYNKALKKRGSLTVWFDPEMCWKPAPSGKRGRQAHYSDAAIQACLTLKVLLGLPLRQATGFVESLLELINLDWDVPDFSTLCRPLPGSACLHAREGSEGFVSYDFPIVAPRALYICSWIALGSRLRAKVNGTHASMAGLKRFAFNLTQSDKCNAQQHLVDKAH